MVKINNRDFKIYDLDSEKTINERIAVDMKTHPNFLVFPNGIPTIETFSKDQNIVDKSDIIIHEKIIEKDKILQRLKGNEKF